MKSKYNLAYLNKHKSYFILLAFLITLIFDKPVKAQQSGKTKFTEKDSVLYFQLENIKTHKINSFILDQAVCYKLFSEKHYKDGWITRITDSTISFQDKDLYEITTTYKDLYAFKIPRSRGRRFAAGFLSFVGGLGTILAATAEPGGTEGPGARVALVGTIPLFALGIVLGIRKTLYLDKSLISTHKISQQELITRYSTTGRRNKTDWEKSQFRMPLIDPQK